jgi:succinate dehydrogenase / fumarate reductase flavoprotein subunit/fumarate reductase flavoprotein subunit
MEIPEALMSKYTELRTDIAVLGSGGAGLLAVLHAKKANPDLEISLVSKGAVGRSGCTRMVQGGFNAVLNEDDSLEKHYLDTLKGGKFLNDQELAWTLVEDAPKVIRELEVEYGAFFDRTDDGRIKQKAFAGQSFDRTVHKGDLTGIEIMSRLREQMFRVNPRELEDVRALDLILSPNGEVAGITCLDVRKGTLIFLRAKVVIVATGGSATMYRIAAPAREKTGDGVAMCIRAGLEVRDMEMLQFHPTGLLAGESRMTGAVLEEGLRGAGAYLLNSLGERYMKRYDPVKMERATRDVVARASYMEIMAGRGTPQGGVFIDISHLGEGEVLRRFPGMVARTRQIGGDLATRPVEVSPTSHYAMGGVMIDKDCYTSVPGLLVAGEDAGGSHGANRLGGNGVAESTVYGCRAGSTAAAEVAKRDFLPFNEEDVQASIRKTETPLKSGPGITPFDLTRRLKDSMWENCGVVRSAEGLNRAQSDVKELNNELKKVRISSSRAFNVGWNEYLDLENQLTVAESMIDSAIIRTETRGSHTRSDFPDSDHANWLRYIVYRKVDSSNAEISLRDVEFTRVKPEFDEDGDS